MNTFDDFAKEGKCDVCGKRGGVTLVKSYFNSNEFHACESCFQKELEPYQNLAAVVSSKGSFPDGFSVEEVRRIRQSILRLGIPESDFLLSLKEVI